MAQPTPAMTIHKQRSDCDDEDLEFYVQEAGATVGLIGQNDEMDAKVILYELFQKVSEEVNFLSIVSILEVFVEILI